MSTFAINIVRTESDQVMILNKHTIFVGVAMILGIAVLALGITVRTNRQSPQNRADDHKKVVEAIRHGGLREAAKIVIGQRATQLAGPPGHIVVRVERGGEEYRVFVLDYRDERDTVLATKGPFKPGRI